MYTMRERKEMIHKIADAKKNGQSDITLPFHRADLHVLLYKNATVYRLICDGICKKSITAYQTETECDDYFGIGFNVLGCLEALAM